MVMLLVTVVIIAGYYGYISKCSGEVQHYNQQTVQWWSSHQGGHEQTAAHCHTQRLNN